MSYCRFGDDSDVYCYLADRYVVHVGKVTLRHIPKPKPDASEKERLAWAKAIEAAINPLGLPHDGQTASFDCADRCADYLEMLRGEGYLVPQHSIDRLRNESGKETNVRLRYNRTGRV